MKLNQLPAIPGARTAKTRVGRGRGSGHGKTSTYGQKGQKARSGGVKKPGFAGGQTPLALRFPKRGFNHTRRKYFAVVNLSQLAKLPAGSEVTSESLWNAKVISQKLDGLRVLGEGELKQALNIQAAHFSKSATAKIEAAGGKAVVVK